MTVKTRNIIIGVFIAIIVLFLVGYITGHRIAVNASNASKQALNKEITRMTTVIADKTVYITTIEQELKTIKQAKSDGDVTNEELRKLNIKTLNELTRAKITIDTLLANISNSGHIIPIQPNSVDSIPQNAMLLPFGFEKKDAWLNLKGTFNSQGILDISLKLDFGVDVWSGIDKSSKLPIAKVTSDSPYLGVLTINSVKMDSQTPKKYNVSLFLGYGLTKDLILSPVLAIGIGRSIFRF